MEQIYTLRQAIRIIEKRDTKGKAVPFDARFFKKDGGVATFKGAVCSSSYHRGTMNIYSPLSGETRKVLMHHLFELNGREVRL